MKKKLLIVFAIVIIALSIYGCYKYLTNTYYFGEAEGEKTDYVLKVEKIYIDRLISPPTKDVFLNNYNIKEGDYFTHPLSIYNKNNTSNSDRTILEIISINDANIEIKCKDEKVTLKYNEEYIIRDDTETNANTNEINTIDRVKANSTTYIVKFQKRVF